MSKEIINKDGTLFKQRTTPDWQEGYEQGLLAGFTKSIVLVRHLQRSETRDVQEKEILEDAMILISENIEANNERESK